MSLLQKITPQSYIIFAIMFLEIVVQESSLKCLQKATIPGVKIPTVKFMQDP